MKTVITICLIFNFLWVQAQETDEKKDFLHSALTLYEKSVWPYLDQKVSRQYEKDSTSLVRTSQLALLKSDAQMISHRMAKQITNNGIKDKQAIAKLISDEYRKTFKDLPKEFYDKTEAKIRKL